MALDPSRRMLLSAIIVLILAAAVAFMEFGGTPAANSGRGAAPPDPCKSGRMPGLGAGLACNSASGGRFAVVSALAPAAGGVASPGGAAKTYPASDGTCVSESACQAQCMVDSCTAYTYDSSCAVAPTYCKTATAQCCPSAGSVCTTYTGALPLVVSGTSHATYKRLGIPVSQLPPPPG